jgi:hypothetical protein
VNRSPLSVLSYALRVGFAVVAASISTVFALARFAASRPLRDTDDPPDDGRPTTRDDFTLAA